MGGGGGRVSRAKLPKKGGTKNCFLNPKMVHRDLCYTVIVSSGVHRTYS